MSAKDPGTHHFWGLRNPSLVSQVEAFSPDAVLLMNYNYASLYNFLWQWNSHRVPLLFRGDSHRLVPPTGFKAQLRRQIISLIYQRFAACLYVGKANYEYFRYHGIAPNQLFFSPHAVENNRFFAQVEQAKQAVIAWKQELGIPAHHRVILFAGKFEPKKRPLDLLQAFLQAQLPQVSLLLVGAGALETELKEKATAHPHIYFAPFQNQTLMPRTYAVADIVVLPSYGGQETWGLAINEAMCLARPVIVSTHVGCAQDLVHAYQNGLTFPAGDVTALANCLREAFSNPQRLQKWGMQSHQIISSYSYKQATEGLRKALKTIKEKSFKF
ncbi:glycosyltransferase family 4 protein [Kovacikia minuta CCNUW1]|uniref:glycosyltransferase family 4 protein n=1 Tax=Kovacikia minuta TaxID=2931930 RepID=UPI001CCA834D|nr:glycosyltransferase family 4 protein [Kovacikia minuta]UBF27978.1 glycosyltransferase family 4 protein [Kovacikia minuta CCNUW1]